MRGEESSIRPPSEYDFTVNFQKSHNKYRLSYLCCHCYLFIYFTYLDKKSVDRYQKILSAYLSFRLRIEKRDNESVITVIVKMRDGNILMRDLLAYLGKFFWHTGCACASRDQCKVGKVR